MISFDRKPEIQIRKIYPVCKGKCITYHNNAIDEPEPIKCVTCDGDGHVYEWVSVEKFSELISIN